MQTISRLCLLLLCSIPSELLAQEPRPLFDGKSLQGWEGDERFWSVENGELVGRSSAERPLSRSTWLIWRGGELRDFRLELDFQLHGGNSGVQFRSRDGGNFQVDGYQADLEDGPDWSGCLYEQGGRGVCARRGEVVSFAADGTRTAEQRADSAELLRVLRPQQWNRYAIEARGPSIAIFINGVEMTRVADLDPARFAAQGILALQLHQGPPMEVRFRNITLIEYAAAEPAPSETPAAPRWIWAGTDAAKDSNARFERRFTLPRAPKSARLSGCADNHFKVSVNSVSVLDHDEWERPVWAQVEQLLRAGENLLEVVAENDGGPAGIQLALDLEFEDGSRERIITDGNWSAATVTDTESSTPVEWRPARDIGALGTGVWGKLGAPTKYAPVSALSAAEIVAPEGVKVELLYTVPRRTQGSWVAMCFDDRGRIIASDQYGSLYRVTLEGGQWKRTERLDLPLGSAHGLCFAFDALYVVVSNSGEGYEPGLWRAKYIADEDRFDAPQMLKAFDGDGEHGPHAVLLSPDKQSLFVVGGNHTEVPEGISLSRVPQRWGEDQLLPQHTDPNGHAVEIRAPGGWICRTDRDGERWELFAVGFRNAYDMAFDANGEAFTFDSDMEWDIGLPWYRPTMIEHVIPGGDYGWRTGSWRWPAYYPDSLPGAIDIGPGSPTGMCFIPQGADLALGSGRNLLVGDWAYGRIFAVGLDPRGASFGGSFEVFLQGKPLPVTDMEFGPDGALYFLVGGRRTQSALYRVSGRASESSKPVGKASSGDEPLAAKRRALGQDLGALQDDDLEHAWLDLDSSDRFVRFTARTALEHQVSSSWIERALAEPRPWASIEALIAVARCASPDWRERALERFEALPLESMEEERLLASLRALQLICIRLGRPTAERAQVLAARLDALYPNGSNFANRELCSLLVFLEAPQVAAKTLDLIDATAAPEDQIALAWSLRALRSNWTLAERSRFFQWMNQSASGWSGGLSYSKYLDNLRDDAVESLASEERRLLGELIDKPRPKIEAVVASARPFVRRWTVDELHQAASEARKDRDFERGERIFREARCVDCHRISNHGGGSGPDLTGVAGRFNDRDLLEAMLEPSKTISDQYQDIEVLTVDERLIVGRVERLADGGVRVLEVDAKHPREIPAEEVASLRPYPLSRMPGGVLDSFTEAELLDLIAYLRAGGKRDDAAFRK